MRDYYRDMDLATNATADEIKGQFKRLAKQFHPDKNNSPYAEQRFKEITDAYSVLSDTDKRQQYDYQRQMFYNNSNNANNATYQQPHNSQNQQHSRKQGFDDFFNSPLWGAVKGFAGNVAQDFVQGLDREIQEEYDDVDPFVERVTKITTRQNDSGSITVTCTITREHLKEITALASRGLDIEDFSADVGVLFASALSQAIMSKWRGY